MKDFDNLIKRLLVHEAFDRRYPIKNRYTRPMKEVDDDITNAEQEGIESLQRKDYALNRMDYADRYDVESAIVNRNRLNRNRLEDEREDSRVDDFDEEALQNIEKNASPEIKKIRSQIIELASKRIGIPEKEIIELISVQKLIKNMMDSWLVKKNKSSGHQSFGYVRQKFESKSGLMEISLTPRFYFDEYSRDLATTSENNGIIEISFKLARGSYGDVTGGGDAAQVVATVMEFAFAVFSVVEAGLKLLFPDFYKWKKEESPKVISFSGMPNYASSSSLNRSSKTAKEGGNKRNRLYTLGWERSMRKRVPDLELVTTETDKIYIQYIES